jgi:hypothetical protein
VVLTAVPRAGIAFVYCRLALQRDHRAGHDSRAGHRVTDAQEVSKVNPGNFPTYAVFRVALSGRPTGRSASSAFIYDTLRCNATGSLTHAE